MGLDSVDLIISIEKYFSIDIPNKEAEQIATVGDIHDTVWRHIAGSFNDKENIVYRKEMESAINEIIAETTGFELEEISAEKRIADDLGID